MFRRTAGLQAFRYVSDSAKRRTRSERRRSLLAVLFLAVFVVQAGIAPAVLADPASPVSVVTTASSNPVTSGDQLTYTIVMTNLGGSKVDNVVMTDQVNGVGVIQAPPALPQLTITSSKGNCSQGGPNGNVVTCNAGTLAGREVWTVTIRGQVTAANNTTLNNTASVTGTKSAQTFTTTGSVSVLVSGGTGGGSPLPDLTINKTGPTGVALNAPLTYTLTVNNLGTANTSGVRVMDTLPPGVTLAGTPFETTSLFTCLHDAPADPITVTCDGGAVNQGQNATIKINAISPASGSQITNTAVVDPDDAIEESNELNNTSASVNTSLQGPPPEPLLSIAKTDGKPDIGVPWDTGAGPDPVNPGEWLTYVIQVRNNASSRADDVRISDTFQGLEASTLIVSQTVVDGAVGQGRGCVVNAAEAICSIRSLNAGGTLTMTVKGFVIAPAGTNLFNTATVHGNIKNVGVTNTSSESTTVRPSVDLTIVKTDSPDPICARSWPRDTAPAGGTEHLPNDPTGLASSSGDPSGTLVEPVCLGGFTYRLVIGNSGNGVGENIRVRDPLPAGVIFDSYDTNGGFACALDTGNVVVCTGGSVPPAETRFIELRLVAPPTVGSITNTVTVDPNNAIFEPDETNNTDTETTEITTGIDLVIWKGDDATAFDTVGKEDPNDNDPPGDAPALDEGFDPISTNGTQTYTIIVDNVGPQDVTGIKVRDVLPAGVKFLSFSATQGFTCTHDGATLGGSVTCIGGSLPGTEREFYDQPGPNPANTNIGNKWATIKIKVFATQFVQPIMHNEVRVDPDNEIDEIDEGNNFAFQNTIVGVGNDDQGAFNQLTVDKIQCDPAPAAACTNPDIPNFVADPNHTVAQNGVVWYDLKVSNLGTDPVSAVVVRDFLPAGSRFIQAFDTDTGTSLSDAFFCVHDGAAAGGIITCLGGDLSGSINKIPDGAGLVPTERHIRVKIFAPNTPGSYPNIVVVDPDNVVNEGNEFDNDDAWVTTVTVGGNNAFNELTIDKTQTKPDPVVFLGNNVATSSIVEWEIEVSNLGTDPAFNVQVTDTLPAGWTFISANDTSGPSDPFRFVCIPGAGNTVNCTGATLSGTVNDAGTNPDTRTIVLRAFSSSIPGNYVNTAIVDPANAIPEGNETNNTATESTQVSNGGPGPFIDLKVDKIQVAELDQEPDGDKIKVDTGQGIHYQLVVSNLGEATALNVTVRDVIPANTTFFSASDGTPGDGMFTCAFSAPNVDCSGGNIPPGGSRTINVILVAPTGLDEIASDPGAIRQTLTNQAFVDPSNAIAEGDEANNQDLVQTTVESQVNLTIDKSGPTGASQNETTKYEITVSNTKVWGDGRTAFGVKVVDPLPVGLIPIGSVETEGNFSCQISENPINTVTCVGDLAPDQDVKITIHVFITADGGVLDNEACVDPDHVIDETSELDNCETAITGVTPAVADLAVNKSVDKGTVTAGETLTYTVAVINQGTANATGTITMNDPLPSQVTFANVNPDAGWTCTGGATVNCTRSGLDAGATSNIRIEATVNSGATGPFSNTATVTGNSETETGTVSTGVGGSAVDLAVAGLSDSPDPANVGQNITYTFAVANGGSSPSGAFDITAKMDSGALNGLSFVGAAASQGFSCGAIATDTVTCSGALLAGQATNVGIEFQVLAASPGSHTLEVSVDPDDDVPESSNANNQASETTTVTASLCTSCIDLVGGGVLDTPDPVAPGGSLTYIATMSNAGDLSTASVGAGAAVILVALDDDVTLGSYSATAGFVCFDYVLSLGLPWVQCSGDLGPGEGVAVTVNATASGAADGDVLDTFLFSDPFDALPEGSGAGAEFTNANNDVIESTSVVAP